MGATWWATSPRSTSASRRTASRLRRAYALAHAVTSTEATASLNHALGPGAGLRERRCPGTSSEIDHAIDLINIRSKPYNELLKARDTCARKRRGPRVAVRTSSPLWRSSLVPPPQKQGPPCLRKRPLGVCVSKIDVAVTSLYPSTYVCEFVILQIG